MAKNVCPDAVQELSILAVTMGDFYPCHQFVGNEKFLMGNVDTGMTRTDIRDEFKPAMFTRKRKVQGLLLQDLLQAAVRPILQLPRFHHGCV